MARVLFDTTQIARGRVPYVFEIVDVDHQRPRRSVASSALHMTPDAGVAIDPVGWPSPFFLRRRCIAFFPD